MKPEAIGRRLNEILRLLKTLLNSESTTRSKDLSQPESWKQISLDNKIQLLGLAIQAFNLFLILATVFLTMRSYVVSRDTLNKTQRAFLSPRPVTSEAFSELGDDGKRVHSQRVIEDWENTGSTPAPVVISLMHYSKIPESEFENFKFTVPPSPFRKNFAAPHARVASQIAIIPAGDFVPGSTDRLTIWGWMAYRDVIPHTRPHLTEFCYYADNYTSRGPLHDPIGGDYMEISIVWNTCERHNCVDDSCEDFESVVVPLEEKVAWYRSLFNFVTMQD